MHLEIVPGKDRPEFIIRNSKSDSSAEPAARDFSFDLIRHSEDGNLARMREDIAAGADVNFICKDGSTPMMSATRNGRLEAVRYLVEQGGDPFITDGSGATPLIAALRGGNPALVRYLVEKLHAAVNCQDRAVNCQDRLGWTPLYCAVLDNHPELVRYLLEQGADPDLGTCDRETPLMLAAGREFCS